MLHYLFLVPTIFEIQAQSQITNYASLSIKSNFKLRFYYLFKCYKNAFWQALVFFAMGIYLCILDPLNIVGFIYLVLSPLLLINYTQRIQQALILLSPVIFIYYELYLVIPIFFMIIFMMKNTIDIRNTTPHISISWIFTIGFFIFILLLIFSQRLYIKQLLLLGSYVLMSQISGVITVSKKQITIFKNRYILWSLKSPHLNLKFLNRSSERKLYQGIFIILYSIIILFLNNSLDFDIFVLCLFYIFMMLQEFDYLIHHTYFNQSRLYDDFLSRVIFRQFMSSSLAFYLLFLAIKEVFLVQNKVLPFSSIVQLGFVSWCILWVFFFTKRFNKKPKLLLIIPLLLLSSCSKQEVSSITIQDTRTFFSGKMLNKEVLEIYNIYDSNTLLHLNHGDSFKKGDLVLSIKEPHASTEIERVNFQINHLNDKIVALKNKLSKVEAEEKTMIQDEIIAIQDEVKLLQFDKGLIKTTTYTYAPFDGSAYINESNIRLLSSALALNIELSEHEYRTFKEIKKFKFSTLDDVEIDSKAKYLIEPTSEGYLVVFDAFDFDSYVNQSIIITAKDPIIFVEEKYVRVEEDIYFVNVKDTECIVEVKYDNLKDGYYLLDGVKIGDTIYAYH